MWTHDIQYVRCCWCFLPQLKLLQKHRSFGCHVFTSCPEIRKQSLKQEYTENRKIAKSTSWCKVKLRQLPEARREKKTGSLWGSLRSKKKNNWEEQKTNSSVTCFPEKQHKRLKTAPRVGHTDDSSAPVWMPSGSKFSMLQTVTQLSAMSLTTSYSTSFQPSRDFSTRIWRLMAKAWAGRTTNTNRNKK